MDLEKELLQELEKFDVIFAAQEATANASDAAAGKSSRLSRGTISTYELAAAESEKEELQDRLRVLLSKTEDYDQHLRALHEENLALRSANEQLFQENQQLNQSLASHEQHRQQQRPESAGEEVDIEDFRLLEFKLAETRSKLARTQQLYEDLHLAKEHALREMEQERISRVHVEKERDAYSAAYEASLQHFEKWTKAKVKPKPFQLSS